MKTFYCDKCGNLVFFENVRCLNCGHALGYLPEAGKLAALEPIGEDQWKILSSGITGSYRQCANGKQYENCNWMVSTNDSSKFCLSCRLNETIPDLAIAGNKERWHKLEKAKRRIVYTLLQLRLPREASENRTALRFRFLANVPGQAPVTTGHENGLITINISEADDDEREHRRVSLHEPYRTLLGHLRHEVAHYYWDRLIENSRWLNEFRAKFGDETRDYAAALESHYKQGAPADWQSNFVSAYASSHPWEDWAETWAHYFHIIDTVETAASFGVTIKPKRSFDTSIISVPERVANLHTSFDAILANWFPLTYALNSLNRGMGLNDLYPFVISVPVVDKLRFIHSVIQSTSDSERSDP